MQDPNLKHQDLPASFIISKWLRFGFRERPSHKRAVYDAYDELQRIHTSTATWFEGNDRHAISAPSCSLPGAREGIAFGFLQEHMKPFEWCEACHDNGYQCEACGHDGPPLPEGFQHPAGYVWADHMQLTEDEFRRMKQMVTPLRRLDDMEERVRNDLLARCVRIGYKPDQLAVICAHISREIPRNHRDEALREDPAAIASHLRHAAAIWQGIADLDPQKQHHGNFAAQLLADTLRTCSDDSDQ